MTRLNDANASTRATLIRRQKLLTHFKPEDWAQAAFLGKKDIEPDEKLALNTLGILLYCAGYKLHTSMSQGSNLAVVDGYRQAGGSPIYHTKGLHDVTDTFIAYVDIPLQAKLVAAVPDWKNRDWLLFSGLDKLLALCEAALLFMEESDARPPEAGGNGTDGGPPPPKTKVGITS